MGTTLASEAHFPVVVMSKLSMAYLEVMNPQIKAVEWNLLSGRLIAMVSCGRPIPMLPVTNPTVDHVEAGPCDVKAANK